MTRAISRPRSKPDETRDMAVARCVGGAMSPIRGSIICCEVSWWLVLVSGVCSVC